MRYLITGGSGYFGSELKHSLLQDGHECINVDLHKDPDHHPNLISEQIDISEPASVKKIFDKYAPFDCVFHAAAQLQLTRTNRELFHRTNKDSAQYLADNCVKYGTKNVVFISSNCVYGKLNGLNITEETALEPFEEYGKTKVAAEKILLSYPKLNTVILRPPTIIGEGRLGILSIVFDFIRENRKIWLTGSGENRYQFIYSNDLIDACQRAAHHPTSAVFNVGCDDVPSLNDLFQGLIDTAKSKSKIYHLPERLTIPAMKFCFKLGISPLGPYQYNMIANTFIGNTDKIKKELNWQPTKSNLEMLADNYFYYVDNYHQIHKNSELSGHRKAGKAGILALVKLFS